MTRKRSTSLRIDKNPIAGSVSVVHLNYFKPMDSSSDTLSAVGSVQDLSVVVFVSAGSVWEKMN